MFRKGFRELMIEYTLQSGIGSNEGKDEKGDASVQIGLLHSDSHHETTDEEEASVLKEKDQRSKISIFIFYRWSVDFVHLAILDLTHFATSLCGSDSFCN